MASNSAKHSHFELALGHVERLIGSQEVLRAGITDSLAVARTAEQREASLLDLRACELVLTQARLVRDELLAGLCGLGNAVDRIESQVDRSSGSLAVGPAQTDRGAVAGHSDHRVERVEQTSVVAEQGNNGGVRDRPHRLLGA